MKCTSHKDKKVEILVPELPKKSSLGTFSMATTLPSEGDKINFSPVGDSLSGSRKKYIINNVITQKNKANQTVKVLEVTLE